MLRAPPTAAVWSVVKSCSAIQVNEQLDFLLGFVGLWYSMALEILDGILHHTDSNS